MNSLKQLENGLIGTEESCSALQKKSSSRILVISDSHGQTNLVSLIIERMAADCDAVIFCGDGIGDFIACLDKGYSDKKFMQHIPPVVAFVEGNGDAAEFPAYFNPGTETAAGQVYYEVKIPRRQILRASGHVIYIVHGHSQRVYYETYTLEKEAEKAGADVAVYGHTHVAAEIRHEIYLMNPGSCSSPRRGTPPGFSVLEINGKNINTIFYKIDKGCKDGVVFTPFFPENTSLWA